MSENKNLIVSLIYYFNNSLNRHMTFTTNFQA